MAELSGVVNIERFTTEIQSLPIGNDIRVELISCLQNITGLNLSDVGNTNERNNPLSRYDDVIILLNKFAKAAVDALGACELLPFPLGIICKVITEVVGFMFSKDIASVVINRFTAILEADLIAKCLATCTKIAHCVSYMQALPSVDSLQQHKRFLHLQLLASDLPIQTGLDEVLFLGEKIKQMVRTADVKKANTLFEHTQLYCCLTTYRELFLLYRFAIQSSFSVDAGSVSSVLSAQKTNDRDVLRFLYKPTTRSVRLFRCCFLDNWLILWQFLDRHKLVPDDLSEVSGRKFKIKSMRFDTKFLRPCSFPLFREHYLRLCDDSNNRAVHLEFQAVPNNRNVFSLWSHCYQPPRQVYCDKLHQLSVSEGVPPAGTDLWYILRVHPETPMESTCYMIWLALDHRLCLYSVWNYNHHVTDLSYRSYDHDTLTKHFAVKEDKMSTNKTSKVFKVLKTTFLDRLNGKVDIKTIKSGHQSLCNQEQEALFVGHLKTIDDVGYGYSQETLNLASDYAVYFGVRDKDHPLTDRWLYNFFQLSKKMPDSRPFSTFLEYFE